MKLRMKQFIGLCIAGLMTTACAQSIEKATQPPSAQNANAAPGGTREVLPSCIEAQEKYSKLAGELPKDYPALHFDKEQLIKTIVEIANNPKINMEELARIFGLKFVASSVPAYVKDATTPTFHIWNISNSGYPLQSSSEKRGMSAYYNTYLEEKNGIISETSRSISLYFDFGAIEAKHQAKLNGYNCVVETDFSEYLKDVWQLSAYYGHVGWKEYRKTIDKQLVEFRARPFVNPDLKRDSRLPFPPQPTCITSVSISIKPVK